MPPDPVKFLKEGGTARLRRKGSVFQNVGQAFRPAAGFLAGFSNAGQKPGGSPEGLPHKNRRGTQRNKNLVVQALA